MSSFNSIGTSQKDNCIIINITDLTEEKINTFNDLFGEHEYIRLVGSNYGIQNAATFKPVSYTHLDVYKRQVQGYCEKIDKAGRGSG